ncbi:hypothetical protein B0H14DRAFT_2636243 [Mycena olivaceomarginata]|nr:hypothetical protein B0H14DRAFT_2636243 [Mycena olivaceomarginata]
MIVGGPQAAGHKEAEKEMLKLDLWNEEFPSAQELIKCREEEPVVPEADEVTLLEMNPSLHSKDTEQHMVDSKRSGPNKESDEVVANAAIRTAETEQLERTVRSSVQRTSVYSAPDRYQQSVASRWCWLASDGTVGVVSIQQSRIERDRGTRRDLHGGRGPRSKAARTSAELRGFGARKKEFWAKIKTSQWIRTHAIAIATDAEALTAIHPYKPYLEGLVSQTSLRCRD